MIVPVRLVTSDDIRWQWLVLLGYSRISWTQDHSSLVLRKLDGMKAAETQLLPLTCELQYT